MLQGCIMIPFEQIETVIPQYFDVAELESEGSLMRCASALSTVAGCVSIATEGTVPEAFRAIYCSVKKLRIMTCYFPRREISVRGRGELPPDQILMLRSMEGPLHIDQDDQTLRLEPGEVVFLPATSPFEWRLPQGGRIDCGRLPSGYFPVSKQSIDNFLMRPIAKAYPPLKLLMTHGAYLLMRGAHAPGEAEMIVTHFRQVLPIVLEYFCNENIKNQSGINLSRIKAFIETHLSDTRFDLGAVALKFNVTTRQVQKLFQAEKTTFSRYVLARRLEMARMIVLRSSDRPISTIAYEIGFGDLSYFNRAFRQRFKMTPSAMRKFSNDAAYPHDRQKT